MGEAAAERQTRNPVPVTMWAIGVVFMTEAMVLGAWFPRIADVKRGLQLSDGVLGLCLVGLPVGTLLGFLIAPPLVRGLGPRRACAITGALFAISFLLPGLATSALTLFLALFFCGLAVAQIEVAMNTKAGHMEKASRRRIMSRCHGFWSIGSVIGALIGGGLAELGFNLMAQYMLLSPLFAFIAIAGAWHLPPDSPPAQQVERRSPLIVLPPLALVPLCLMPVGIMAVEGAVMDWSAVFVREYLIDDPMPAAIAYSLFAAAMAVTRFSGDWLAERFGPVRVVTVSCVFAIVGIGLFAFAPTIGQAYIGAALAGFGVATVYPLAVSAAAAAPGRSSEDNVAAISFIAFSAFLVSPPLIGAVAELTSLRWALAMLSLTAAASLLLARNVAPRAGSDGTI